MKTSQEIINKRENRVRFQGEIHKEPRVMRGAGEFAGPSVSLFLKGDTRNGNVFIPVRVTGPNASALAEKVSAWSVGDEVMVEGELDWEAYKKDGKKSYSTRINAFSIYRLESF